MRTLNVIEYLLGKFNLLPHAIYDTFPAALLGKAVLLAVRMGAFESLEKRDRTLDELSKSVDGHPKALRLLLQILQTAGYIKTNGEKFQLTRQSSKWLVRSSPHYIGNFLRYVELLHQRWETLEETVRHGKPTATYIEQFSAIEWNIYVLGMEDLARMIIPWILPKLRLHTDCRTLLDIGGSHGLYSIALCQRYPDLQATIVDLPQALITTEKIVNQYNFSHRLKLFPCDITHISFPERSYDCVLLFNIIHGFREEQNKKLLGSIAQILTENGSVYILDQFTDSGKSGVAQLLPYIVGLHLLNEIGGSAYSLDEVSQWCVESGLSDIKIHKVRLPGVSLIRAKRS